MKALDSSLIGRWQRLVVMIALFGSMMALGTAAHARPSSKGKQGGAQALSFLRQTNVYSNIEFFYTNRGILFNSGGTGEGCFWPRGSGNSYIFGEGLWFATKKEINGKRRKLCELGYNPNSGAGWYKEGEYASVEKQTTDGANPDAKYISYVSPRYDRTTGTFQSGSSGVVPSPFYKWPIWDTSTTKKLDHNFYFGDYISDVNVRANLATAATSNANIRPAMLSEEDIVSEYTDQDPTNNPEFQPGTGYPFGIDITEALYTWSFGRYRDMIFLRHKVTNSSSDSLLDCWMAPAFDPDLAYTQTAAKQDGNAYLTDSFATHTANATMLSELREPYRSNPSKLNMGVQWTNYNTPPGGKQYGWIGFSFLESPVIDSAGNIVANDDSEHLHGYGPSSLFQKNQKGLVTFKDWVITNDPSTQDLRYDFVSSGEKDGFNGSYDDQRLMMATGPFTLPPHKSVETVVGVTIAQVDDKDYRKNFGALLLLSDFAHQVFGEVDSSVLSVSIDSTGKPDTTFAYFVNHFLSPVPPAVPNVKTTALDKAILVSWDKAADTSIDVVSGLQGSPDSLKATLPFLGYQLWRTTRKDHDSTIRPDGANPNVMLGQWQLYDFRADSVFDQNGHFNHFHYTRLNTTPHPIPHSYLDVGDDNHDGILTGSEGLLNGVTYYYYLLAYDEYDSTNKIGPLYTAIVPPKNFVTGIPNKPAYLIPFSGDSSTDIVGNCLAGTGMIGQNFGGVQDIRLDIVDTGIFAKLFTNDTIYVSFQPRWIEQADQYLGLSYMLNFVDVTDTKNGIQNTYANLQSAANNTNAYFFPTTLPGTIVEHVNNSINPDSVFTAQFTTDNSAFAPNQAIDNAFHVLADVNLEQLSAPYRLSSVTVTGHGDPNILRLSRRTNNGSDGFAGQSIYNLPTDSALGNGQGSTRPSFLGALGQTTYEVDFGDPIAPGPVAIELNQDSTNIIHPPVLPITVRIPDCPNAILREVPATTQDSAADMTIEYDYHYYSATQSQGGQTFPTFKDPDMMHVPNPGWYQMAAFHYHDAAPPATQHTNAGFDGQGVGQGATVGPYYFPMDSTNYNGLYQYTVHKLSVGGAEIIFNAPEIVDGGILIGDTIAGSDPAHSNPHTSDFQSGDKVTLSFTGLMKNLPFPGAKFAIKTESGPKVDFANLSNYTSSLLSQVQVVPNPYVVTHLGQTSTDNAKIFFTRLPPRCTIEIYALDGTLVNTIEHIGYQSTTTQNPNDPAKTITTYDYSQLADQSATETWNLLTSGKQRIGSQVLFARVIAKDPITGSEIGETTTKFAVVVAQSK